MEDLRVQAGVEEGSEEHVTTDAGESVEVGDAHGGYCFMGIDFWVWPSVFAPLSVPPPWYFGPKVLGRCGLGLDLDFRFNGEEPRLSPRLCLV